MYLPQGAISPEEAGISTLQKITSNPLYNIAGAAIAGYHGYVTTKGKARPVMAALWALGGALSPVLGVGLAVFQGYGKER